MLKATVLVLCLLALSCEPLGLQDPPNRYELSQQGKQLHLRHQQLRLDFEGATSHDPPSYDNACVKRKMESYWGQYRDLEGQGAGALLFGDLESAHSIIRDMESLHNRYQAVFDDAVRKDCLRDS